MKIGLVLFGNLRSFRNTLSSFDLFKKTLEQTGSVDVFCHTWDIEESVTSSWWKENKGDNPPTPTVNRQEIEEAYHPVKLIIEPSIQFDESAYKINASIPVAGILSMLHTQRRAFELLKEYEEENKFRYDVIIKTRFDLLYELSPEFNKQVTDCLSSNCVYLPSSNPYELAGSSSDIFALGSRSEMEKYFSFCSNFQKATEYYFKAGYRQLIPEFCMTVYLQQIGVVVAETTGIRLHILRMNNDKFQINSDRNFTANMPQCFFKETIDANLKIFPLENNAITKNPDLLVKKYISWLDNNVSNNTLEKYINFYNGAWIGLATTSRLVVRVKNNPIFISNVMKSFFEKAILDARYGRHKKFLLAGLLMVQGGFGLFFFRVLMKKDSGMTAV